MRSTFEVSSSFSLSTGLVKGLPATSPTRGVSTTATLTAGPIRHSPDHGKKKESSQTPYQKPSSSKGQKHLGYLTEWSLKPTRPAEAPPRAPIAPPQALAPPTGLLRPQILPLNKEYQLSVLDAMAREQEARVNAAMAAVAHEQEARANVAMTAVVATYQGEQKQLIAAFDAQSDTVNYALSNLDCLVAAACASSQGTRPSQQLSDGSYDEAKVRQLAAQSKLVASKDVSDDLLAARAPSYASRRPSHERSSDSDGTQLSDSDS